MSNAHAGSAEYLKTNEMARTTVQLHLHRLSLNVADLQKASMVLCMDCWLPHKCMNRQPIAYCQFSAAVQGQEYIRTPMMRAASWRFSLYKPRMSPKIRMNGFRSQMLDSYLFHRQDAAKRAEDTVAARVDR